MGQDFSLADCPLRIVILGNRNDPWLTELVRLPKIARIISWGESISELSVNGRSFTEGNVLFCASGSAAELGPIITQMPFLEWVHCLFAGIDHIICQELRDNQDIIVTNAKGVFSSSLAEYVMLACGHFTKQVPRLLENKQQCKYERFTMGEIKGKTMGIVGYGDIGKSCAVLAKAYGCRVIGLRKHPELSTNDDSADKIIGSSREELNFLMKESDFLVLCTALTPETRHMIGERELINCKKGQILINIGRGALVDEEALVAALMHNFLAAAALDVFTTEPLPDDSPLWTLPNVLISPHNADMTSDFRHKSVELFADLCKDYVEAGFVAQDLDNQVDVMAGY